MSDYTRINGLICYLQEVVKQYGNIKVGTSIIGSRMITPLYMDHLQIREHWVGEDKKRLVFALKPSKFNMETKVKGEVSPVDEPTAFQR